MKYFIGVGKRFREGSKINFGTKFLSYDSLRYRLCSSTSPNGKNSTIYSMYNLMSLVVSTVWDELQESSYASVNWHVCRYHRIENPTGKILEISYVWSSFDLGWFWQYLCSLGKGSRNPFPFGLMALTVVQWTSTSPKGKAAISGKCAELWVMEFDRGFVWKGILPPLDLAASSCSGYIYLLQL
jgi:hypothetical protein